MKLKVERFLFTPNASVGRFFIDEKFICYTLEDEIREVKVRGETAIPQGIYEVFLKTWGRVHDNYSVKFGARHSGTLGLKNVPNFTDILIHIGNYQTDTDGCILLGTNIKGTETINPYLTNSTEAYLKVYDIVSNYLLKGGKVSIEVTSIKEAQKKK